MNNDYVETPGGIEVEANTPLMRRKVGGALLERWIEASPEQALQKLEVLGQVLAQMTTVAIKRTFPTDWIIHTTVDRTSGEVTRQVGYLQDDGCNRAGKIWGIECGKPKMQREDQQDGTYTYIVKAPAWSRVTGETIDEVLGSRWSGDKFFTNQVDEDAGERVDPSDVQKAAWANLHGRAVRALGGLGAVPVEVLRQAGIDTAQCMFVGYVPGAKGGTSAGASTGGAEPTMPFGNSQGKKAGELDDKDLNWYLGALGRSVEDPTKTKFKAANERILTALRAEQEKRRQRADHAAAAGAEGGAPAAAPSGGPTGEGVSDAVGKKRGDLWAYIEEAAGKSHGMLALRTVARANLGRDIGGLSDLTDDEMDSLAKVPRAVYAEVSKAAKK